MGSRSSVETRQRTDGSWPQTNAGCYRTVSTGKFDWPAAGIAFASFDFLHQNLTEQFLHTADRS